MIEKWKTKLNNGCKIGAIIMDLSKAFDTLNHDLLLSKLCAYGFCSKSINFLKSYLSDRKQRCKIGDRFSEFLKIICGVPQGSILGPLLFNIFLNDLFLFIEKCELCNYADDNTLYAYHKEAEIVLQCLERDFSKMSEWFKQNSMILNPKKCHFMMIGDSTEGPDFNFEGTTINYCTKAKILGVTIDNKLSFNSHINNIYNIIYNNINNICVIANQKLNALSRVSSHMNRDQIRLTFTSFVKSIFNYCPLIWMFSTKTSPTKINSIHKRSLRLILNDYTSDYEKLLFMTKNVDIHQHCNRTLMVEVFKFLNGLSPDIINEIFVLQNNPHNLRFAKLFQTDNPHIRRYGLDTVTYRSGQLWGMLPSKLRESNSLQIFKDNIRNWKFDHCPCNICRSYIANVGYI